MSNENRHYFAFSLKIFLTIHEGYFFCQINDKTPFLSIAKICCFRAHTHVRMPAHACASINNGRYAPLLYAFIFFAMSKKFCNHISKKCLTVCFKINIMQFPLKHLYMRGAKHNLCKHKTQQETYRFRIG